MTANFTLTLRVLAKKAANAFFRLVDSNAIVLLLLILFSAVLFQHALVDYPRKDHETFLAHKANFEHPAEWCQFAISYSRTRFLGKGDEYLFRPAHMLFLCVEDVYFSKKPIVIGIISVVSAGIAAFILFLVCSAILKSRSGSLLASLCWLTFFPGMDLILWRHISPYMFSLILGFGGIYYFYGNTTHRAVTRHTIATTLLLCASLFHEISVVALTIFIGVKFLLLIINRFKPDHDFGLSKTFYSIFPALAAIITFTVLNIVDFKINGGSIISPADQFSDKGYMDFLLRSSYATARLIGLSIFALLFPFDVSLVYTASEDIIWSYQDHGIYPYLLWFCSIGGIAIMLTAVYLQTKSKRPLQPSSLLGYSLCFLASGYLAMGFFRGGMRGVDYFQSATYYFSIFTWCWIVVLVFLLKVAMDRNTSWRQGCGNLFSAGSSLFAMTYIGVNCYLITDFTKMEYKPRAIQYLAMSELLKGHKSAGTQQMRKNAFLKEAKCLANTSLSPEDILGEWTYEGKPVLIICFRSKLLLTNDHGQRSLGKVEGERIVALGWNNLEAKLSKSKQELLWGNKSIWRR